MQNMQEMLAYIIFAGIILLLGCVFLLVAVSYIALAISEYTLIKIVRIIRIIKYMLKKHIVRRFRHGND